MKPFSNKYFWYWMFLIAVIFFVLCMAIGFSQSIWFDEAYTIMVSRQGLSDILSLAAIDTHPPLFYIVLHFLGGLVSWDATTLRMFSAIFMTVAVVFMILIIRRGFGSRVAFGSMLVLVASPFLIRYGFEIRMYAFAAMISTAASYLLLTAQSERNPRIRNLKYAGYAILVGIGTLSLYYMALLWIAHVVWLIWLSIKQKTPLKKQTFWLSYFAAALIFLPWLPKFLAQISNGALASISEPLNLTNLLNIVSFNALYKPIWQLSQLDNLLICAMILCIGYLMFFTLRFRAKMEKHTYMLLALSLLVPVVLLMLASIFRPMYVERYLLLAMPFFYGALAVILSIALSKKNIRSRLIYGFYILLSCVGVFNLFQAGNFNFQRLQSPNIAQVASYIKESRSNDVILAADPYIAIELEAYGLKPLFYSKDKTLRGGYAPLDQSPLQVKDLSAITAKKILVVSYSQLSEIGLEKDYKISEIFDPGALKAVTFEK